MLSQILTLLLDVAVGLVAGAALLRAWMQHERLPLSARAGNPLGDFLFALTDWIVLPLRKLLPVRDLGRWDLASLLAMFLLVLAQVALTALLVGRGAGPGAWAAAWPWLPVLALFACVRLVLSAITWLVIVYAVLSWVQAHSPVAGLLDRLCAPLLRPIRNKLPLVGGVDLSPLVLLLLVQVAVIVLDGLQRAVLR